MLLAANIASGGVGASEAARLSRDAGLAEVGCVDVVVGVALEAE